MHAPSHARLAQNFVAHNIGQGGNAREARGIWARPHLTHATPFRQPCAVYAPLVHGGGSGPRVARLFVWSLSVLWGVAYWSLGIQVLPLLGQRGVLPLAEACGGGAREASCGRVGQALAAALAHPAGDGLLLAAVSVGLLAATAGVCNVWPRRMLATSAAIYAGFVAAAPTFFPSIGDKLLLEASVLGLLLPRNRHARPLALLARCMVVRLYVGMGAAQWLAAGGGWQRGGALAQFLQNTPLPTASGWALSQLPPVVLRWGAKLCLLGEICVPFLGFMPRAARLVAALVLTGLQLAVANLVNDGLFSFVAVALHLFLLDEADVEAMVADARRLWAPLGRAADKLTSPVAAANLPEPWRGRREAASAVVLGLYLVGSATALYAAVRPQLQAGAGPGAPASAAAEGAGAAPAAAEVAAPTEASSPAAAFWAALVPVRLDAAYTHAGSPLERRAEPIFEVRAGGRWQTVEWWYEPGDPWRAPRLAVPHQPRLDAALAAAGRRPHDPVGQALVDAVMRRLCAAPTGLQRLARTPLPAAVEAVRVHYDSYTFADWRQHQATGVYWTRAQTGSGPTLTCAGRRPGNGAPAELAPAGDPQGQ